MVNVLEIGLFLYALAGSASIGYWALVTVLPSVRQKEKTTKLGFAVAIGAGYIMVVFILAAFLSLAHFNNQSFLQLFFWLVPLSFIILSIIVLSRASRELVGQYLRGEIQWGSSAPSGATANAPQTGLPKKEPYTVESIEAMRTPDTAPIEPIPTESSHEFFGEKSENEKTPVPESSASSEEVPAGEQEQDVEEEIRRIMRGEKSSEAPAPPEKKEEKTPSKPQTEMDEIEKIKAELRKKIAEEKENQKKE